MQRVNPRTFLSKKYRYITPVENLPWQLPVLLFQWTRVFAFDGGKADRDTENFLSDWVDESLSVCIQPQCLSLSLARSLSLALSISLSLNLSLYLPLSLSLSISLSLNLSLSGVQSVEEGGIFCYWCGVLPPIPAIYELNLQEINNTTEWNEQNVGLTH